MQPGCFRDGDHHAPSDEEELPPAQGTVEEEGEGEEEEQESQEDTPSGPSGPSRACSLKPQGSKLHLWYLQDAKWNEPRLYLSAKLSSGQAFCSPLAVAMTDLYASVLQEKLNDYAYYADCAGLQYSVRNTKDGLTFSCYGYHQKLPTLVQRVLQEMQNMAISAGAAGQGACDVALYSRMKEKVLRHYANARFQQPYFLAAMATTWSLESPRWTDREKHTAFEPCSQKEFDSFCASFLRQLRCEVCFSFLRPTRPIHFKNPKSFSFSISTTRLWA
jgi:insulysin